MRRDPSDGDLIAPRHNLGVPLYGRCRKSLAWADVVGSDSVDCRGRVHEDRVSTAALLPPVQDLQGLGGRIHLRVGDLLVVSQVETEAVPSIGSPPDAGGPSLPQSSRDPSLRLQDPAVSIAPFLLSMIWPGKIRLLPQAWSSTVLPGLRRLLL